MRKPSAEPPNHITSSYRPRRIEVPRRVSFDSNVWEKIFDPSDSECTLIRSALKDGRRQGFICEAGFRIEAVRKQQRGTYFCRSYIDWRWHGVVTRDGREYIHTSI